MSSRTYAFLMVAAMILAAVAPLAIAQPEDPGRDGNRSEAPDNGGNGTEAPDDDNETEERDERPDDAPPEDRGPPERAERARMMGQLTYENGTVAGAFIQFDYDNSTGTISDYTYRNTTVIDSITWDDWANDSEVSVHGAAFDAESEFADTDETENTTAAQQPPEHAENESDEDEVAVSGSVEFSGNTSENDTRTYTLTFSDDGANVTLEVSADGNGTWESDNGSMEEFRADSGSAHVRYADESGNETEHDLVVDTFELAEDDGLEWELQAAGPNATLEASGSASQDGNDSYALTGNATFERDEADEEDVEDDEEDEREERDDEDEESGDEIEFRATDTPSAFMKAELKGNHSMTIEFADGVNVSQLDNWTVEVTTDDGFYAILWKDHDHKEAGFDVDGQTVVVDADHKAEVMWRIGSSSSGRGPGPDLADRDTGREISRAAAQGRLQAEVTVALPAQAADQARQALSNVQAFGNTTVDPQVKKGRVDLQINCSEAGTIVLNVDREVLNVSSADDVEVTFDNETIDPADDLADALNATDDEAPEFLVVVGAEGVQAMVSIPHCSPHTVSIQEAGATETVPAPGAAALMAAIVVAAIGVAAVKRRRD